MKKLKLIKTGLVIGLFVVSGYGISYGGCIALDDYLVSEIQKRYEPEFTCCQKVVLDYYNEHGMSKEDRQRLMTTLKDVLRAEDLLKKLDVNELEKTVDRIESLNAIKIVIDNLTFENAIEFLEINENDQVHLSRCHELEKLDYKRRAFGRMIEIIYLMNKECEHIQLAS